MIANLSKRLVYACLLSTQLLAYSTAFAKSGGAIAGGGGDASEERVSEIRADILTWINKGGAKGLVLPQSISYGEYESKMKEILEPKKVVVGFVEQDDENNPELQVSVNGVPKTCRGFISEVDFKHHILCNISRFKSTSESEQYKLIHHEYAGLVNIENNDEAASDYEVSSQLTSFLARQTVLKLAVKKMENAEKKKDNELPKFIATKMKDMGKDGLFIELTLINSEDVSSVYIVNDFKECGIHEDIILKDGNLSFSFLCSTKYNKIEFYNISVSYFDGRIGKAENLNLFLDLKLEKGDFVELKYDLKSEKIGYTTVYDIKNVIETVRVYEASYNVMAKDLVEYRGVKFDDGDIFMSDDADELASYINKKKHDFNFGFEESVRLEEKCFFGCKLHGKKIKDEVSVIRYGHKKLDRPRVIFLKKGDISKHIEVSVEFEKFVNNKKVINDE